MPTQVPSGSDLAVRRHAGYRKVKARGPRMLRYAGGGMVPEKKEKKVYEHGGVVRTDLSRPMTEAEKAARDAARSTLFGPRKSVLDSVDARKVPARGGEEPALPPLSAGVRG